MPEEASDWLKKLSGGGEEPTSGGSKWIEQMAQGAALASGKGGGFGNEKRPGDILNEMAPWTGGVIGSTLAGAPGAAAGGALGTIWRQRMSGEAPKTGGEAALDIGTEALIQGGGQAILNKAFGNLGKGVKAFREGYSPTPKPSPAPATPSTPPAPFSPLPDYSDYASAARKATAATAEHSQAQAAQTAMQKVYEASQDALGREATEDVTGKTLQDSLEARRDVFRAKGGELFDDMRSLSKGEIAPADAIIDDANRKILERESLLRGAAEPPGPGEKEKLPSVPAYPPIIRNLLEEMQKFPTSGVPIDTLDLYRRKLIALTSDPDSLIRDEAKGLLSHYTGLFTEVIEAAAKNNPQLLQASRVAKAYWKQGVNVFNHPLITKAMQNNPEELVNMINPGTTRTSPGITEARAIRDAAFAFTAKNGTPEEIAAAAGPYKNFIGAFLRRNVLGEAGQIDIMGLPERLKAYGPGVLDALFNVPELPELSVTRTNLQNFSATIEATMKKAGAMNDANKLAEAAKAKYLSDAKALVKDTNVSAAEAEKARITLEKQAEDYKNNVQRIVDATTKKKQTQIRWGINAIMTVAAGTILKDELGVSAVTATLTTAALLQMVMPRIFESTAATNFVNKGISEAITKELGRGAAQAWKVTIPKQIPEPVNPIWMGNIVRGLMIGKRLYDKDQAVPASTPATPTRPLAPIPTLGR